MIGRPADRELAAWLRLLAPYSEPDVAALRADGARRAAARDRGPEMRRVSDGDAAGVPVRLYVPEGAERASLLVYLHGGGWTLGSLDTHDRVCRGLAAGATVRVLSVGYRLAPEHPWPASIDDAVAVLRWVASGPLELGSRPLAVAVGGDSAGATLAALACLRLRDVGDEALPDLQMLLCPNTDLAGETESLRDKAEGWGLDAALVRWFADQWLPEAISRADPGVSPLRCEDLAGLPPALLVVAEHDCLRDEGEAYARRLARAGVTVTTRCEPGLVHGFVTLDDVSPACAAGLARVVADLRRLLAV